MSIKNDGHYFCRAGGNRPDGLNEPVTDDKINPNHNLKIGLKMAYILSMSEQVKLKAFLAAVLDDYKLGAISQQQAVGGITSLVDAIEISDSGKISLMLSEGRKLLRTG
ncbi:hypothetical protein POX87_20510 [Escherichia coli]